MKIIIVLLFCYFVILPIFLMVLAQGGGPATPTVLDTTTPKDPYGPHGRPQKIRTSGEETWYNIGRYGGIAWIVIFFILIIASYTVK